MMSLYRLGDYEIDVLARQLRKNGEPVPLSGKPFELLLVLLERPGRVVSKDELMCAVWQDAFVEEANLSQCVFVLRKALGERSTNARYIVTVPGSGYQLGILPEVLSSSPSPEQTQSVGAEVLTPTMPTPLEPRRELRLRVLWMVLAVVVLVIGWFGFRSTHARPTPFLHLRMHRLTNSGDVQQAAISSSGRYVAYVTRNERGQNALVVSDLKSGGTQDIFKSDEETLSDPAFDPSEAFLFFRVAPRLSPISAWTEMRIPVLGGKPALVVRDIDGPVTFLDGGSRICFGRGDGHGGMNILAVDSADGGAERMLAKTGSPAVVKATCSPDGKRALLSTESDGLSVVEFKSGIRSALQSTRQKHEIFVTAGWNWDGSSVFGDSMTPFQENTNLSFLTYPGEIRTTITHDLDSYEYPSLTQDQKYLVATQRDRGLELHNYLLPLTPAPRETTARRWSSFLGWQDDDTVVGSGPDGSLKTFDLISEREETVPKPPGIKLMQPSGCGRDGWIAMGSLDTETALSIWYMRRDGSGLRRLSRGQEDILPVCTPDGQWAIYANNSSVGEPAIFRVATGGGMPQRIGGATVWFALSPDGQKLAWFGPKGNGVALFIQDLRSGVVSSGMMVLANLVPSRSLAWTPDQRDIYFTVHDAKADAIWEVALDGGASVKVFELPGRFLATISISPGGKRLGVVTAHPVSDAVLIEDDD
jgi:DNA-binding winged helix-turn-helix (wHTH) protein